VTLRRTQKLTRRMAATVGVAGVAASIMFMATPATAASSDLPEDPALPVPSVVFGKELFAKPDSSIFLAGYVGQTDGHGTPVAVVATDASGTTFDVAAGTSVFDEFWSTSGGEAPTVEGRYTTNAYSVTSTSRSTASSDGFLWVDGTAPSAVTFGDPDGYTSDSDRYAPTVNFEPIPAAQFADQMDSIRGTTLSFTITGPGGFSESRQYEDRRNAGTFTISRVLFDPFTAGDYTLTATATDIAGNTSPAAVTHFTIAPPAAVTPVGITTPIDGATTSASPPIAGDGEDGSTVTLTDTDGTSLGQATVINGTWQITPTTPLTAGPHTLTATQDLDGSTATRTITVDIPAVTPTPAPGGGGNGADSGPAGPSQGDLAYTGATLLPLGLTAAALLAMGIPMSIRRRRLSSR